jgi:hypothetical protein
MATGTAIGLLDTIGFFFSVKYFILTKRVSSRLLMVGLELFRLAVLIAGIIYCFHTGFFSIVWLLSAAILVSVTGKVAWAFTGTKYNHGSE